ncbi:MAG: lysine transporter LysE [Chitinophagia bacterium]|jgi:threonine/homoserine/homoserine lactone efflux protein|nr:lysine transporter LysE [Chitinophagia bacterium]
MLAPVIKGVLLGLILSISMGPVIFAIIKQSLTKGKTAGYLFVAGVSASDITLLFVCNVFASLFVMILDHKALVALLGAGFLLLTGLYTLFFKKITLPVIDADNEPTYRKRDYVGMLMSGFAMNTLNPNVFLFWFAWTAAIGSIAADAAHPIQYKLLVFVPCLVVLLLSDLLKVALASRLRPKLTEKNLVWINRISAMIILIFSAALFVSALQYT